jgi:xanthine dehydrogenase molybdopterin-binding subunit B
MSYDAVGRPLVHQTAYQQATGEARYADDVPPARNELHMAFVVSQRPHAEIIRVDFARALAEPGVVGVLSSDDLTAEQNVSGLFGDEEVLRSKTVSEISGDCSYAEYLWVQGDDSAKGALCFEPGLWT